MTMWYAHGCGAGTSQPGAWAVAHERRDGTYDVEHGTCAQGGSRHAMVLKALVHAVERVPEGGEATVWHDSSYVRDALERWVQGWRANGWRGTGGAEIRNRALWMRLDAACTGRTVALRYNAARGAHPGQGAAAAAAREALAKAGGTRRRGRERGTGGAMDSDGSGAGAPAVFARVERGNKIDGVALRECMIRAQELNDRTLPIGLEDAPRVIPKLTGAEIALMSARGSARLDLGRRIHPEEIAEQRPTSMRLVLTNALGARLEAPLDVASVALADGGFDVIVAASHAGEPVETAASMAWGRDEAGIRARQRALIIAITRKTARDAESAERALLEWFAGALADEIGIGPERAYTIEIGRGKVRVRALEAERESSGAQGSGGAEGDTLEIADVTLGGVAYRAAPPLRLTVRYDAREGLYDAEGDLGIWVSAPSRAGLAREVHEALAMLWTEYAQERPEKLSPKAKALRAEVRARLAPTDKGR